jgi:hypothetical protein
LRFQHSQITSAAWATWRTSGFVCPSSRRKCCAMLRFPCAICGSHDAFFEFQVMSKHMGPRHSSAAPEEQTKPLSSQRQSESGLQRAPLAVGNSTWKLDIREMAKIAACRALSFLLARCCTITSIAVESLSSSASSACDASVRELQSVGFERAEPTGLMRSTHRDQ